MVEALKQPTVGFENLAEQVESMFSDATCKVVTLEDYAKELKSQCKSKIHTSSDDTQWPPPVDDEHKVFKLEIIKAKQKIRRGDVESDWIQYKLVDDKVDEVVCQKIPIQLEDIIFSKDQSKVHVLVEGAPGSGKSTLSFHIRHQWANEQLLQDYKLVILIKLRDLFVQNAKSVAHLLQNIVGEVAEEIIASDGEGIMFVLDGWDELTIENPGHSVILDLIKGNKLCKSSIITTCRPTSSANLHEYLSLRVEILGFSKHELRSYFAFCLKNDPKDVDNLLKQIKITQKLKASVTSH